MKLSCLILLIFIISCSKVESLPGTNIQESYTDYIMNRSQYVIDESSDIFEETPWYLYDESNHIIWPTFSVYALRTNDSYYKLQILDYYDKRANPGIYTLRVQKEGENEKILTFNASGCGNVYTNRNYEICISNPDTNIYKYLDIETGELHDFTDDEAMKSREWDLAFNGTSIRLNAGKYGLKGTRIGSLFIYSNFYSGGIIDYQKIAEISFSDRGARFFELDLNPRVIPYALPPGVDRVINEPDWFKESEVDPLLYSAVDKNWWLLKSKDAKSYFKFNVAKIDEVIEANGSISTKLTVHSYYQGPDDLEFAPELRVWSLESFSTNKRLVRLCLDLDLLEAVHCSKDKERIDLTFSALNNSTSRKWKIESGNGAIGPLSFQDIDQRTTGRFQ